jgi:L-ribulose-5-phosphate 4-epimerase
LEIKLPDKPDEGYIKFSLHCKSKTVPSVTSELNELNQIRTKLFRRGFIGVLDSGIGFGNLSYREDLDESRSKTQLQSMGLSFIISGSATGAKEVLTERDYARVVSVELEKNRISYEGIVNASSESMSHAAIYQANTSIKSVIHIHNLAIFEKMIDLKFPATNAETSYGTVAMAKELLSLVQELQTTKGSIVMKGHEAGVIAFGDSIAAAFSEIEVLNDLI